MVRPFRFPAAAALLLAAATAGAHPLSVSYSHFEVRQQRLTVVLRLPLDDLDLLLQLDEDLDDLVSREEIQAAREAIARYALERLVVSGDGAPLTLSLDDLELWHDSSGFPFLELRLSAEADAPLRALEIRVAVLSDLYSDHRNLSELVRGADRQQFVFQHANAWRVGPSGGRLRTAGEFARLGVEHIFTGYDHVLFLVGLLLVASRPRQLVLIVTSFTLAHSVTLALATLGLVEPGARLVEALIALSIAWVGAENLLVEQIRHRWRIAFGFGLVHGFGFAGILKQMDLERGGLVVSLLSFNLGVEVGQLAIVALLWPGLWLIQRSPQRSRIVRLGSALIVACGVFWFVERIT